MKERKLPFMGGTIIALVIILVLVLMTKLAPEKNEDYEPTEIRETETRVFFYDTEFTALPTE